MDRRLITIRGCVQGVGFRPFIYRLALEHQLAGSISNSCSGVKIDVQGKAAALDRFVLDIVKKKPKGASIADIAVVGVELSDATTFLIAPSEADADKTLALLPDTAMCKECLKELFDPTNRRYRYPFLHCISCGPRFSLFTGMPFDRERTTMRDFSMCQECRAEYQDPDNRRFYSQTNCCPQCGPKISAPIEEVVEALKAGKIIAMKNTGGYLLLVDAMNDGAVERLRKRKRRPDKPFAVLTNRPDDIGYVNERERELLSSPAAPIVLLRKKGGLARLVAHDSPHYGVMLPHSALQHLLMEHFNGPLVATSGNISGGPICIEESESVEKLSSIADLFLHHNRKIKQRLDDSIVQVIGDQPVVMRRARGYIPCAFSVNGALSYFAAGSQMKNSFAFLKDGQLYMSQHMGDLDSVESCKVYDEEVEKWENLLGIRVDRGVGDKHPAYYGSQFLEKKNIKVEKVQHHKAHLFAGMVDAQISYPFFALAFDGTGWGDDSTVWGGEAFHVSENGIERAASLYPFLLPGNDKAVREPRRALLGMQYELFGKVEDPLFLTMLQKRINTPLCSSVGRLFDGVSALLGLCEVSSYEGQAALLLEKTAYEGAGRHYTLPIIQEKGLCLLDWRPMIREIFKDKEEGVAIADIAMGFHEALARGIVDLAKRGGKERVLLTGGVMQNRLLVEKALAYLEQSGFKPFMHRDIPPNDGGIAAGQLMYVSSVTG